MAAPLSGQITLTGTAQPLSPPVAVTAFTIKAPLTNNLPAYIGPAGVTTGTGYQLDPGDEFEYQRQSQSGQARYELGIGDFYAVGTGPDKVTWLASP